MEENKRDGEDRGNRRNEEDRGNRRNKGNSKFAQAYLSLQTFFDSKGEPLFEQIFKRDEMKSDLRTNPKTDLEKLLRNIDEKREAIYAYDSIKEQEEELFSNGLSRKKMVVYKQAEKTVETYRKEIGENLIVVFNERYKASREVQEYVLAIKDMEEIVKAYECIRPYDKENIQRMKACMVYAQKGKGKYLRKRKKEKIRVQMDRDLIATKQQYEEIAQHRDYGFNKRFQELRRAVIKVNQIEEAAHALKIRLQKREYVASYFTQICLQIRTEVTQTTQR